MDNSRCQGNDEQFEALAFVFESGATGNPRAVGKDILIEFEGLNSIYGVPEEVEHKI